MRELNKLRSDILFFLKQDTIKDGEAQMFAERLLETLNSANREVIKLQKENEQIKEKCARITNILERDSITMVEGYIEMLKDNIQDNKTNI